MGEEYWTQLQSKSSWISGNFTYPAPSPIDYPWIKRGLSTPSDQLAAVNPGRSTAPPLTLGPSGLVDIGQIRPLLRLNGGLDHGARGVGDVRARLPGLDGRVWSGKPSATRRCGQRYVFYEAMEAENPPNPVNFSSKTIEL